MVHAIGVTAALVLIDVLVNFIIFIVNPGAFRNWCINDVRTSVQDALGNGTTVASDQDYYNCDRLFNDQVKWSLICVFAMYIIYASITRLKTEVVKKKKINAKHRSTGCLFLLPLQALPSS